MTEDEARDRTARIIDQLHAIGRAEEASYLHRSLAEKAQDDLMLALHEACDTVLSMIEGLNLAFKSMLEELRSDVRAWLGTRPPSADDE